MYIKASAVEKMEEWLADNGIPKITYGAKIDGYYIDWEKITVQFTNYDGNKHRVEIGLFYRLGLDVIKYIEIVRQWFAKNTKFTPFPKFTISDLLDEDDLKKNIEHMKVPSKYEEQSKYENDLKDFIYKVDDTDTLKVQSNYESVESFFADKSDASYSDNESIVILAVDTKLPIIKLEKQLVNKEKTFKFIVDIKTKDEDQFMIKTTIDSKEKFVSLLESTINSLKEFELFYKYAEDLENCL